MSLRDVNIKIEYRSLVDNIAREFFVPLLNESVSYKRAVGFFSSSVLVEISKGIMGVVKNGGSIRLIASPYLSSEDVEAIQCGYASRAEIVRSALIKEMKTPVNKFQEERLNLLANLIADGILDIKVALTDNGSIFGMYHEKVGIFEDNEGNKVAFSGSMNESANALLANYETIDVFCGWEEFLRVEKKEESFDRIWNNCEPNIRTIDMEDINQIFISKYQKNKIDYNKVDVSQDIIPYIDKKCSFFRVPNELSFYDYQKEAITKWMEKSCCGIFDMATGTGKTYTALGALSKLSEALDEKLAVVIVVPYIHLVEQWVTDICAFNVKPIVAYAYKGQNWRREFTDALRAYNLGVIDNFCLITTNSTFMGDDFQQILKTFRRNFCFVVDEAHNFGAKKLGTLLPRKARYRLALSATIERHRDKEGTELLQRYFGKEPCISFSLKTAIKKGFLTPYYYYPVVCCLDASEREAYVEITEKIQKASKMQNDDSDDSYLERLLIQRARIVAGCRNKIDKLISTMSPHKNEAHMLIYCGATKYDRNDINDDEQIKQIDEVNYRLYNELGLRVRKFTSDENGDQRQEIKDMFLNGDIQAITAIKCLDEGVNIPSICTAFILASSTNPKEYIQRRGRVLRKAKGKEYAVIYDFITLPRPLEDVRYCSNEQKVMDLSLVKREFTRMLDFADTARNPSDIDELRKRIIETYKIEKDKGGVLV